VAEGYGTFTSSSAGPGRSLAEPYRGSDAYVTDGQYMVAMVSTFEGTDLVMAEAAAE
jgi:hypothetical protein